MPGRKLDDLVKRLQEAKKNKEVTSIGYHGNIVTVWERLVEHMQETGERLVDLGSDQVGEAIGHFKKMAKFSEIPKYIRTLACPSVKCLSYLNFPDELSRPVRRRLLPSSVDI